MNLQHRMPLLPADAKIVSQHLAVGRADGRITFFNASGPIFSYREDDEEAVRFGAAMLSEPRLDLATPSQIADSATVIVANAGSVVVTGLPSTPIVAPETTTGTAPFRTSSVKHVAPRRRPSTRPTLVAPMFFEPCSRMSTPRSLPMRYPNGIDPTR